MQKCSCSCSSSYSYASGLKQAGNCLDSDFDSGTDIEMIGNSSIATKSTSKQKAKAKAKAKDVKLSI